MLEAFSISERIVNYDAFGLMTAETYGLDYESAREVTPRWYGVSFGNGNDGVSHMWPDYYVRTADPWLLAGAAMLGRFLGDKPAVKYAAENTEIDGEADYTINATILNPPDDDSEEDEWICGECGQACTEELDICPECEAENSFQIQEPESWCNTNGAWIICEVFPIDDMDSERSTAPRFESLLSAFSEADLKEAESI